VERIDARIASDIGQRVRPGMARFASLLLASRTGDWSDSDIFSGGWDGAESADRSTRNTALDA